jgi:hypothetical protein
MASSAFPVLMPMYPMPCKPWGSKPISTIDGGFVANNPTTAALYTVGKNHSGGFRDPLKWTAPLRVLSIGTQYQPDQENLPHLGLVPTLLNLLTIVGKPFQTNDAGWFQWLLAPPLRLPNVVLQASVGLADAYCQLLLEPDQYHRMQLKMAQGDILTGILFGRLNHVIQALDDEAERLSRPTAHMDSLIKFILDSWMTKEDPQAASPLLRTSGM